MSLETAGTGIYFGLHTCKIAFSHVITVTLQNSVWLTDLYTCLQPRANSHLMNLKRVADEMAAQRGHDVMVRSPVVPSIV